MDKSPEISKAIVPQRAYISFTTEDLSPFKDIVASALREIDVLAKMTQEGSARIQGTVESCYRDIESCDLYIGLVGHRIGWVPNHSSNTEGLSIIELEYLHAQSRGMPCLIFMGDDSVRKRDMDSDLTAIESFRSRLMPGSENSQKMFSYDDSESLAKEVIKAVQNPELFQTQAAPVAEPLTPEQDQFKQKLISKSFDAINDEEIDAVYKSLSTPASIEAWLLKRWTHWARRSPGVHTSAGQLQNTFVNLQLQLHSDEMRDLHPEFEKLDSESKGERTVLYEQLSHALQANSENRPLWVLLGPPGAGKTTVLQHYELMCIESALASMENGSAEKPELCIWLRLSTYKPIKNNQCPVPDEWLEDQWQASAPGLPALDELKEDFRLRFLLDGINEIPASIRRDAVDNWSQWVEEVRSAGQVLPPVFSVRVHEYTNRLHLPHDVATEVQLRLWQRKQINEYIDKQVGSNSPLAGQITQDNQLIEFYGLPLNLYHLCELYRSPKFRGLMQSDVKVLIKHRGRLYIAMLWLRLQRLLTNSNYRQQLNDSGLLTERHCQALEQPQPDFQNLRNLLEKCPLVSVLKAQALTMQREGTQISVDEATVAPELGSEARAVLVESLQAMQIADIENIDQFRFVHQQWQEFFAALALAEILPESTVIPDFNEGAIASLKGFAEVFEKLTVGEALPVAPPGRWAETCRLLLELTPHRDSWFSNMAGQNPPLTAIAAEPVHECIAADKVASLRDDLLHLMKDPEVDLRHRLLCGHALPRVGDPRYQEHTSADGIRYLLPTEDRLIQIPAGQYQIGSLDGASDEHCDGQLPRVMLSAYRLAFAPVTNAEFECFIESDGYSDDRWWIHEDALKWRNGRLANEAGAATVRRLRKDLLDFGGAACQEKYRLTDNNLESWVSFFDVPESDFERGLESLYSAPGVAFTEPGHWRNPLFNLPAQPVVGVCWFEAVAYCQWLAVNTGRLIQLPIEAQWEAAARGAERRSYPWGNPEPTVFQMNADAAHLRCTSPVGVFAQADTTTGLADMAGNVIEWCADWYGNYQIGLTTTPVGPAEGGGRVLRGGGWFYGAGACRSAFRLWYEPSYRGSCVGFRFAQVDQPRSES